MDIEYMYCGLIFFEPVWFLFSFVSEYVYVMNLTQTKINIKLKEKFEPQHIHIICTYFDLKFNFTSSSTNQRQQ